MKKIIALILALIMTFSMGTVAFAEDAVADDTTTGEEVTTPEEDTSEEDGTEEEPSDFDWLLDLPFWTVKPAAKIAKIALKFVKVYVKLAVIFGVIDKNDIISQIEDLIGGVINNGDDTATDEVAPEEVPEETAPAA